MAEGGAVNVEPDQILASTKAVAQHLDTLPMQAEVREVVGPKSSVAADFFTELKATGIELGLRAYGTRRQVAGTSLALTRALKDYVAANDAVSDDISALLVSLAGSVGTVDKPLGTAVGNAAGATTGPATGTVAGSIG